MITLNNIGWQSGLRDWVVQRFTGIYIFFYFLFFVFCISTLDKFNYQNWHLLFSSFLFKLSTILFVLSLVIHSSIGVSVILTDYVKQTYLRVILDFLINIMLLLYILFIMQILWGF